MAQRSNEELFEQTDQEQIIKIPQEVQKHTRERKARYMDISRGFEQIKGSQNMSVLGYVIFSSTKWENKLWKE